MWQTGYAGVDERPAARREKSPPSERVLEIPDAATSAIPLKTSAGKEWFPFPTCAVPSACPSSPTRPWLRRRADHLAGYSPRRSLRAPSTPNRRASTSTHSRAQKPVAMPFLTLHAAKVTAMTFGPSAYSYSFAPWTCPDSGHGHALQQLRRRLAP